MKTICIIPTHRNRYNFLEKTIGVIKKDKNIYKIIIINNGSTIESTSKINNPITGLKSDASMIGSRNNASMVGSRANVPIGSNSNSSSNTQVTVNGVTVNTKATDGDGIARDLGQAIKDNSMVYNGVGGTLK